MVIHAPARPRTVTLTIDGTPVTVPAGTTIWTAARAAGIDIPVLCHDERYDPVGVCRICVVDTGARVYAAACVRPCEDGMDIKTATPDIERNRATLTELLLADQPARERDPKQTTTGDNELLALADRYGASRGGGLPTASGRGLDMSNPVIAVDHDACILCDRCVRACDDIQGNDVIGRSGKGYATRIAFDLNDPMGASSCVTCGECVAACPTGALTNKPIHDVPIRPRAELDSVDSVCPYCGVGCALTYQVDRERGAIAFADGRDQPGSKSRLCVKGRYGWDYAASPQRLTTPLIRREEAYPKGPLSAEVRGEMSGRAEGERQEKKGFNGGNGARRPRRRKPGGLVDYAEVLPHFREATWDEALDLVARRLTEVNADVAIVTGSNPTANHPVASSFFKQARRRGTTIIYVDPRADKMADHSDIFCQLKPGTDVALYNGIMHEVIRLGLTDSDFISRRTTNFAALAETVRDYPPERAAQITGVDAAVIRRVARVWGEAGAGVIFWGMGISQHTTGTDNARCLIAMCAITGNIGRPGSGLHPLR